MWTNTYMILLSDTSPQQAEVTNLTSEINDLKVKLKEKDDMNGKLKQLAIKSKKEVGDKQKTVDKLTAEIEAMKKRSGDSDEQLLQQLNTARENYMVS